MYCIIEVLYRHLAGGPEKKHEKRRSRKPVSLPRFEKRISEIIQAQRVTISVEKMCTDAYTQFKTLRLCVLNKKLRKLS
jgi:hypothetical protein